MSFGYGAFGNQEWIRKIKPKPFFEHRKSPAGDSGEIRSMLDYQSVLNKKSRGVEMEPWEKTPSNASNYPIIATLLIVLAVTIGLVAWIF